MPQPLPVDLPRALSTAINAAKAAGVLLRAELHRAGGPRGHGGHAEVDAEAERVIRDALVAHDRSWGYVGEELNPHLPHRPATFWLVDPNDATSAFMRGYRGSAVSIALIHEGAPVLGVVYAFAAPDDDGDLIAWAEGCPLTRDGAEVHRAALPGELGPEVVVALNHEHDAKPIGSSAYVAPGRFRAVPSIAYRLALVAAGEVDAAVATGSVTDWDTAGGHALLRAVGGELVDARGEPVRYRSRFDGAVYGGSLPLAQELAARGRANWESDVPKTVAGLALTVPAVGAHVADAARLARAQGCLLGQLAGDALGSLVEFQGPSEIARRHPDGVRDLRDGGCWDTLAGQPTDDSEMALTLARCLARDGRHDLTAITDAYRAWAGSGPFDMGTTTSAGLAGRFNDDSKANGSLMRVSPLAVWAHRLDDDAIAALARAESGLTHRNDVCRDACAVYCVAVARAVRGEGARTAYEAALAWAKRAKAHPEVIDALTRAETAAPADMVTTMGLVTLALQNAFYALLHAGGLERGVIETVGRGGDTDTNAAIAGALLGAVYGREGVPLRWRRAVSSCHPQRGAAGVRRPRPTTYWPVDALTLAERLLHTGPEGDPARLTNEPTRGHVFAYLGRVEDLHCDARLVPVYRDHHVKDSWLHEDERWLSGAKLPSGGPNGAARTVYRDTAEGTAGKVGPDLWITDIGLDDSRDIDWPIESAKQWLPLALARLYTPDAQGKPRELRTKRGLPLLALHLVGSGRNNAEKVSGELVRRLLDAVEGFTKEHAADVVIVVNEREQYAALQHARRKRGTASSLPPDLEASAKALAEHARAGKLCLLTGAGVSVGAGLPTWNELLSALADAAGMSTAEKKELLRDRPGLTPAQKATLALDRAGSLAGRFSDIRRFREVVAAKCDGHRVALAHGLLASLPVNETVTLNYDTLFERAARADASRPLDVILHGKRGMGRRWLLKLHGCRERVDDIVLTQRDYHGFEERRGAFKGIVESLLITRHMLFVGFGTTDPNLTSVIETVLRAVDTSPSTEKLGTVLSLDADPPDKELYERFQIVRFDQGLSFGHRVRQLEVFLDRVALLAADPYEHLLDPRFADLVGPEGAAVREAVEDFVQKLRAHEDKAEAATRIIAQLQAMGFGRPSKSAEAKAKGDAK